MTFFYFTNVKTCIHLQHSRVLQYSLHESGIRFSMPCNLSTLLLAVLLYTNCWRPASAYSILSLEFIRNSGVRLKTLNHSFQNFSSSGSLNQPHLWVGIEGLIFLWIRKCWTWAGDIAVLNENHVTRRISSALFIEAQVGFECVLQLRRVKFHCRTGIAHN